MPNTVPNVTNTIACTRTWTRSGGKEGAPLIESGRHGADNSPDVEGEGRSPHADVEAEGSREGGDNDIAAGVAERKLHLAADVQDLEKAKAEERRAILELI
jgi:hypothetical protein